MIDVARSVLLTAVLARQFRDGELCVVGGASPIPFAGARLAQETHAPNLTLITGSGAVNPRPNVLPSSGADPSLFKHCEAILDIYDVFDHTESGRFDVACFGGIQVDRFGNFNLTAIAGSDGRPKLRGPGLVNAGVPMTIGRFILFVPVHSPRVFVERVDLASGLGRRDPDGAAVRNRSGEGPVTCITPLGQLGFDPTGRLTVVSVHDDSERDLIPERTGFDINGWASAPVTQGVSPDALAALEAIDPTGLLSHG